MTTQSNYSTHQSDDMAAWQVFRQARTLFFVLLMLALIVNAACFWTVNSGYLDEMIAPAGARSCGGATKTCPGPGCALAAESEIAVGEATEKPAPEQPAAPAPAPAEPEAEKKIDAAIEALAGNAENEPATTKQSKQESVAADPKERSTNNKELLTQAVKYGLSASKLVGGFVAVAFLFCLLIGLQIALVGGFTGLSDSSQAVFLALVAAVLIVPWAASLAPALPNTFYGYGELMDAYLNGCAKGPMGQICYYLRFVALWVISLMLVGLAQHRSCRAAKLICPPEPKDKGPIDPSILADNTPAGEHGESGT